MHFCKDAGSCGGSFARQFWLYQRGQSAWHGARICPWLHAELPIACTQACQFKSVCTWYDVHRDDEVANISFFSWCVCNVIMDFS